MDAYTVQDRDFVIIGLQPWDTAIGSNCKNIALEISRNNRVLYINYALDRQTLRTKKTDPQVQHRLAVNAGKEPQLQKVGANIWQFFPKSTIESINVLPEGFIFDFFNKRNNRILANEIATAIQQLGFKNYILFNDSDMFRGFYLGEMLKPALYIYYSRDNPLSCPHRHCR